MNIRPKRVAVLAICFIFLMAPGLWIILRDISVAVSIRVNESKSTRLNPPSSGRYTNQCLLSSYNVRKNETILKSEFDPLIRIYNLCRNTTEKFNCVPMKTLSGKIPMCIHSYQKDRWVSGAIQMYGIWEKEQTILFQNILKQNPGMNVVDLGAQLGMYSLLAANMGRAVLAVEPMRENVRRFHKSVQLNGFQDRITLVMNGLSDKRGVSLFQREPGNVGGTKMVDQMQNRSIADKLYGINMTQSVYLDDLTPMFHSQKLFVKIDVEGSEGKVITFGHDFFLCNDVRYVMMEWEFIKTKPEVKNLIDFFQIYKLEPYDMGTKFRKLDLADYMKWPQDILWIRYV